MALNERLVHALLSRLPWLRPPPRASVRSSPDGRSVVVHALSADTAAFADAGGLVADADGVEAERGVAARLDAERAPDGEGSGCGLKSAIC